MKAAAAGVYKHKWADDADGDDAFEFNDDTEEVTRPIKRNAAIDSSSSSGSSSSRQSSRPVMKKSSSAPIYARAGNDKPTAERGDSGYITLTNVKEAHQCHEWGEAKDHMDNLRDFVESFRKHDSVHLRCLSAATLIRLCTQGSFRQFLRSKAMPKKILTLLQKHCQHPAMAMCAAAFLYLLARDRQSIELDKKTLETIIRLIKVSPDNCTSDQLREYEKSKKSVWQSLDKWRRQQLQPAKGSTVPTEFVFDITEDNLSSNSLATEALVFISARNSEQWFKNDMRHLGGLDLIVDAIVTHRQKLPDATICTAETVETVRSIQRVLKIIEHLTFMNDHNQSYLIGHKSCALLNVCSQLFAYCREFLLHHPFAEFRSISPESSGGPLTRKRTRETIYSGAMCAPSSKRKAAGSSSEFDLDNSFSPSPPPVLPLRQRPKLSSDAANDDEEPRLVLSVMTDVVRVLCNLSHNNELCCTRLGQLQGFLQHCVHTVTWLVPVCIPKRRRFDVQLLLLGLLANLLEHLAANRRYVLALNVPVCARSNDIDPAGDAKRTVACMDALVRMFLMHDAAATAADQQVDQDIAGTTSPSKQPAEMAGSAAVEPVEPCDSEIQEMLSAAMRNASGHMEHSLTASYFALVIGCLIQHIPEDVDKVKSLFPAKSLKPLLDVLEKLQEFMEITHHPDSIKSIQKVQQALHKFEQFDI